MYLLIWLSRSYDILFPIAEILELMAFGGSKREWTNLDQGARLK